MRTFQIPRPFGAMSVLENMLVPTGQSGERFWNPCFGAAYAPKSGHPRQGPRDPGIRGLTRLADEPARNLSGGQLKLLELGRSLMSDPKLILLDEPGAGVNPTLLGDIIDRIAQLNAARRHLPHHRAQHGSGDEPLSARHRDGGRQAADAGRAAGRSQRPPGSRSLSRRLPRDRDRTASRRARSRRGLCPRRDRSCAAPR